jgi:hypothetical protein
MDSSAAASRTRRLRGWIAVLALAALTVAETPHLGAMRTFAALIYMRTVNWADYERNLTTPGSGLEVLPATITGAAALLRDHHAERYRLGPGLASDPFLMQRIAEVTWPVQMDAQAKFVLRRESEPQICMTIATASGVALDRCD